MVILNGAIGSNSPLMKRHSPDTQHHQLLVGMICLFTRLQAKVKWVEIRENSLSRKNRCSQNTIWFQGQFGPFCTRQNLSKG